MQHIWIFQLEQAPDSSSSDTLIKGMEAFLKDWKAHGAPVPGHAEIRHGQFLIVRATPGTTSGCSIDAMHKGVEQLLGQLGLQTAPHNFIFYKAEDGSIQSVDFREVQSKIQSGEMGPETTLFDSSMSQTNDFSRWEVKLQDSWLSRFLPQEA